MEIAGIIKILRAATAAAETASRALEAAHNGDPVAAERYLTAARGNFDQSLKAWDEAHPREEVA